MNPTNLSTPLGRIHVIDALRGFALLGIIIIHTHQRFGVFSGVDVQETIFSSFDPTVRWLVYNVFFGKFINIFAFLFGLSFFIQMDRGAKKGIDFRGRFLWRMAILFLIGIVGNAFFTADILSIYAVFGIILVFLFPLKNKYLLIICAFLMLGAPRILYTGFSALKSQPQVESVASLVSEVERPRLEPNRTFIESARHNLTTGLVNKLNYQFSTFGRGYVTFALFILGLIVGRIRFFEKINERKRLNFILFGLFVISAIIFKIIIDNSGVEPVSFRMAQNIIMSPAQLAILAMGDIFSVLSSGAIVMTFVILYQFKGMRRCLDVFTPYGRMGLTNYEMQSVVGCLLFSIWAFGSYFGAMGATQLFFVSIIIYVMQIFLSRIWLADYVYGPLEWLWRSLTYLKFQPFKRGN